MRKLHIQDHPYNLLALVRLDCPEIDEVLDRVRSRVPHIKREISEFQGAILYWLASQYNREGARILEIGTAWGYSAAILAEAAPLAQITTLNPKTQEVERARDYLSAYPNVEIAVITSWDFLEQYQGPPFDMQFIDGDHKNVVRDLPWFDKLNVGGLQFHHDYSPDGTWRPCPPVFEALNEMSNRLGRPFDVLVRDPNGVGIAGFYRLEGEAYNDGLYDDDVS